MDGKNYKVGLVAAILILALCGGVPWVVMRAQQAAQGSASSKAGGVSGGTAPTRAEQAAQGSGLSDAARDKVITYFRERFGVPDTVKLSLGSAHPSIAVPSFNEAVLNLDDGKKQGTQLLLISKDMRFLIVVNGKIVDLNQNSAEEMVQRIHETFKTPANQKLSMGAFKPSLSSDFEQGTLTVDSGQAKQDIVVLRSRDGKHLILSEIFNLTVDPKQLALRTIALHDEPTQGPADAPVTIVEYADLQCPTCAHMHEFLETQVVPRYGNKVRVVFKEYPLPMHDWSLIAAVACQCAYEINPPSYVLLRSAIFRNQQFINITNLREMLLSNGEQAGVDRVKLAGCLDARSTLPRVQRDLAEGKRVTVDRTPTLFINGRKMVGLPSDDAYFQAIDAILGGK
ncbi:MAG TPA: thioredoxin domain-containing protein [Terriglobia bacterium]|nr:thioredoxin domain-containing protein [Terriglobia bacterium]